MQVSISIIAGLLLPRMLVSLPLPPSCLPACPSSHGFDISTRTYVRSLLRLGICVSLHFLENWLGELGGRRRLIRHV